MILRLMFRLLYAKRCYPVKFGSGAAVARAGFFFITLETGMPFLAQCPSLSSAERSQVLGC